MRVLRKSMDIHILYVTRLPIRWYYKFLLNYLPTEILNLKFVFCEYIMIIIPDHLKYLII